MYFSRNIEKYPTKGVGVDVVYNELHQKNISEKLSVRERG